MFLYYFVSQLVLVEWHEMAGFRTGDYKLIRWMVLSHSKNHGHSKTNWTSKYKTGVGKSPGSRLSQFMGGKKSNRSLGTGGSKLKIGITAFPAVIPALLIILNAPGFHDWLIIAFQPLKSPYP